MFREGCTARTSKRGVIIRLQLRPPGLLPGLFDRTEGVGDEEALIRCEPVDETRVSRFREGQLQGIVGDL